MRKLFLFNLVSLDGFFEGPGHDISWHHVDEEFNDFAIEQMRDTDVFIFGRRTYELMEGFWPNASEDLVVADLMNTSPKIVYSKTLKQVSEQKNWKHITLFHAVDPGYIEILKKKPGKDIAMFGSADLADTFFNLGLIDEVRLLVNPLVLGKGTPLFKEGNKRELKLVSSREFKNGNVLLTYRM